MPATCAGSVAMFIKTPVPSGLGVCTSKAWLLVWEESPGALSKILSLVKSRWRFFCAVHLGKVILPGPRGASKII